MKYIKNNLLSIYIIINILYIFISTYLYTSNIIFYGVFGKSIIYASIINIVVSIITFIRKKIIKKDYKIELYDVLILSIILFALISLIFAHSRKIAIYGMIYRYEGIYAIIYYLTLTYLSSFIKKDNKRIISKIIVVIGLINTLYAYLQITGSSFVTIYKKDGVIWAAGLLNNPNFYASFILMSLAISLGIFIEEQEKLEEIKYGIIVAILVIGLLISNTTSCAVGLIVVLIYLFIYCIKNKYIKKFLIITGIITLETLLFQKAGMTTLIKDINKTKNETIEISKGNFDPSYGTKRIELWRKTSKLLPKYLIHGVGIDNFAFIDNGSPLNVGNTLFDKAHNEYLQILITQGIFSLLSYLALFIVIVIKGIKNSFKSKKVFLILPVIGYLTQAFFNISVIEVAPIFYILLGLLIERENCKVKAKKRLT